MTAEISRFLEYLFALPFPIPILRDLADLSSGKNRASGPLKRKMERRYRRLCRVSKELGSLDLKKAAAVNVRLEDFVFDQIDFDRYRKIPEKDFDEFFLEGLEDFGESFFKKNFSFTRKELKSLIDTGYQKEAGEYKLQRETSLVLSVMRTLETSLEAAPLFTAEEIIDELQGLPEPIRENILPNIKQRYPLLVSSLINKSFTHSDGMTTKLFISAGGDLSGTFLPGNKPWTLILIPAALISR